VKAPASVIPSQPCPKDVCPVPPLATDRVPVMVESVVVATQAGIPFCMERTKPPVPAARAERVLVLEPYIMSPVV